MHKEIDLDHYYEHFEDIDIRNCGTFKTRYSFKIHSRSVEGSQQASIQHVSDF